MMTTSTWRTAGVALTVTISLITGACAAAPDSTDAPAPSPTTPPITSPTTTQPATAPTSFIAKSTEASIGGCQLFPPDHFLNATGVDRLPVHPKSAAWTNYLARGGQTLDPPSSSIWEGARGGMPINVVDSREISMRNVLLDHNYSSNNYTGPYPIPSKPKLEGYPSAEWDRHLLMLDVADCNVYELIQYDPLAALIGIHRAMSGVRYPLDTTDRPVKTTNAAKTPMVGQYAMFDEVQAGRIAHVIGFCTTDIAPGHIWPAGKSDGRSTHPDAPPMGTWLRLKGGVDRTKFTGQARVFVDALRRHGMVLTDICGHQLNLMAENSGGWNNAELRQLRNLDAKDFEAVDTTPMRTSIGSFRVN